MSVRRIRRRSSVEKWFAPAPERESFRVRKTPDSLDSYESRSGFDENFIGSGDRRVSLPGLGSWSGVDQVAHRIDAPGEYILRYQHFSVVVARQRRMPLISAVNIDGNAPRRRVKRTDVWKLDPRIPIECQILEDCYGHAHDGFFSRGHMTRREDANWGSMKTARLADADTFHVTNAVPQAQSFNSPIWLGLESYLLTRANADHMRVSVITGPILSEDDLEMFGMQIPSQFWKVIAFVNDRTCRLSVAAYLVSQELQIEGLRELQFVFGQYRDWQVPLRRVAKLSGLDFLHLLKYDPLSSADDRFVFQLKEASDVFTQ